MAAILKNRYDVITPPSIVPLLQRQNDMPMTTRRTRRSKSKPEVKFQYGGHPFSETGSTFNSAVDWDISSKFGMHMDFHLKRAQSLNLNPKVDFRLYGRHLEKSIWRHNSAVDRPITTKFGMQMQSDMPMTAHRSKSKPEVKISIWRLSVFWNRK